MKILKLIVLTSLLVSSLSAQVVPEPIAVCKKMQGHHHRAAAKNDMEEITLWKSGER